MNFKVLIQDGENGDLLNAAQVSLGCLGIIVHVTFQLKKASFLKLKVKVLSFEQVYQQLKVDWR